MADDDPIVTSAKAEITARDVSGVLVGVNTGVINKNFFGGNVYQRVQVYVLNNQGRNSGVAGLIEETTAPYKFLTPYTAADVRIFVGRDDEVSQVNRIVHEQRLLVVHGKAGVGKTSLLAAGVIPKLIEEGLLVLQIQDYVNPADVIYQALRSNGEQIKVSLPEKPTFPKLLQSVVDATEGTLVLVLDQFELLFEASITDEQRETFIASLVQSLNEIPANLLRLIIVLREEARHRLWELDERLPGLLRCQFEVLPFNSLQAEKAIKEPLRVLKSRVTFYDDLVEKYLVPDLGEVSNESDAHFVHPPHLQIVCTSLYQKATEHDPPRIIDKKMYLDELKGADGIIAGYLKATLEKLEDEKRLAFGVMSLMATPGVERWVLPSQLQEKQPDVTPAEVERILNLLVSAGLLVRRAGDGKFSFVSPTIAREMVRLAGPEVERRTQAGNELERIWLSWLARNVWATRGQLRYLETSGTHLTPRAVQSLLMLRSAVERREATGIWLSMLRKEEGPVLVQQLEGLPSPEATSISLSVLNKGAQLLGLGDDQLANARDNGHISFGPVSQNAVTHPRSSIRQSSVLALSAASNDKAVALARLDESLAANTRGLRKKVRRAELRGALADADSEFESRNENLPVGDRLLIWRWRAVLRISRERRRWIRLMLGGAIGAGLALAIMRALISAFSAAPTFPGIQFGSYFFYGFILGGSLSLGIALERPLRLSQKTEKPGALVSILLGTLFFGVAHMLVTILNGLSVRELPLGTVAGFVAGFILSAAVYVASYRWRGAGVGKLLLVVLGVGILFGLLQLTFNSFREMLGDTIVIGWPGSFYSSNFGDYVVRWWPGSRGRYTAWFDRVAILDLGLAGIFLTTGLVLGISRARKTRLG